jgi:hypothetical protein
MTSNKLIVTHRGNLLAKYGEAGVADIEDAVAKLVEADTNRGIRSQFVHLDDADEVKHYQSKKVPRLPTAASCKRVIDKICSVLTPDYVVLLGADDVIPHFLVPNPTRSEDGDTDVEVPTDNPYAASPAFNAKSRASYLVTDRVVGRIPDVPGAKDPAMLLAYLRNSAAARPLDLAEFAADLLVCCDAWQQAGRLCVAEIARQVADLNLAPPADTDPAFPNRYGARLQMIKCHGAPLDPHFYGQKGESFPAVLDSTSLTGKTSVGTVVGAMCCYGAAVYDPSHPAAIEPGVPALANIYLGQGTLGFAGSTTIAWVGVSEMACADLIVCRFLNNVMTGMSLGAAFLDSKQRFLADIGKNGQMPDAAEEKTLLQFVLLGDPSLRAVTSREERDVVTSVVTGHPFVPAEDGIVVGGESGKYSVHFSRVTSPVSAAVERRTRRDYQVRMARTLRETLPEREVVEPPFVAQDVLNPDELLHLGARKPVVYRVTRAAAPIRKAATRAATAAMSTVGIEPDWLPPLPVQEQTLQYYWFTRTPRERVVDATMIKVETDLQGHVLRKRALVSA